PVPEGATRPLIANPDGAESVSMKVWLTPMPSRFARPIEYNGEPFVHQTFALSTAIHSGLPAGMENWVAPVPVRVARPILPALAGAREMKAPWCVTRGGFAGRAVHSCLAADPSAVFARPIELSPLLAQ